MPNELTSPFENDMFALVAMAFQNLYPGKQYRVKWVTEVKDPDDNRLMGGMTFYPDDGGIPFIEIPVNQYVMDAISALAHELAHVAVGYEAGHDVSWEAAYKAIRAEYDRIGDEMFEMEDSDGEVH